VFASYSSKAQNTTYTMWLLGYKYFVHFSSRRLFADKMKKTEFLMGTRVALLRRVQLCQALATWLVLMANLPSVTITSTLHM